MTVEAGVLVDLEGEPIFWHIPKDRSVAYLPDSRDLWDVIWENRDNLLGFAHSHPGSGVPGPSYEDTTTFAAVELALGKRLLWWIVTVDSFAEFTWTGPGKLNYYSVRPLRKRPSNYLWVPRLREFSDYQIESEGGVT